MYGETERNSDRMAEAGWQKWHEVENRKAKAKRNVKDKVKWGPCLGTGI
jgi:hypothetical protein